MFIRGYSASANISRCLFVLLIVQACIPAHAYNTNSVKIGNFLQGSPCGIAWIVDDSAAFVLDTGGPYVAGTAAPDDSYHLYRFTKGSAHLCFEWGRTGNNVVGRISTDAPVMLDLTLSSGWPKWSATTRPTEDGATQVAHAKSGTVHWALRTSPGPTSRPSASKVSVSVTPKVPLRFVAGLSHLPSFASIDKTLEFACCRYECQRPRAAGAAGDFVSAIADNLNNSRLYATDNHLVAHCVSRTWGKSADGFPYFEWDSFFNANLAAIDDPLIAQNTIRAIFSCQTKEGMVPNFGHWDGGASTDRSEPPVAALCIWKMHQRNPNDLNFLGEIYPKLVAYHNWWPKYRDAKKDGLLEWGTAAGDFQSAKFETGWDDNIHFTGALMKGNTMNCYAVDLCSMWSMDAHYLALIADALHKAGDAARFRQDETDMNRRINEKLWNAKLGIYCSRFWDDAETLNPVAPSAFGSGFDGEYFSDETLKTSAAKHHDDKLDFNWKDQPPIAPLKTGKNWSARWKTTFTPPSPGHYQFHVTADDGVRVIVNGKTVIDDWSVHVPREKTADVTYTDVKPIPIVIEYYQHEGGAEIHFSVSYFKPTHGAFLTRLTPMNFYPLSAGAADPQRARRVLAVLTDPKKFWGTYMLPTASRDDPDYHFQQYWRGDVWGPANYLVWPGIRRYATAHQATEFADHGRDLFMKNWLADGICSENFSSITGEHGGDAHYTWGALLNLIALENILDVDDSGQILLNGVQTKKISLHNIPILGRRYDVQTEPGSAALIRDGQIVLSATGTTVCTQTPP